MITADIIDFLSHNELSSGLISWLLKIFFRSINEVYRTFKMVIHARKMHKALRKFNDCTLSANFDSMINTERHCNTCSLKIVNIQKRQIRFIGSTEHNWHIAKWRSLQIISAQRNVKNIRFCLSRQNKRDDIANFLIIKTQAARNHKSDV